ncbi:type I restriction-modification system subunit M N-terminal domain-containing protein [Caldimonas tepidiphila]|uniref:type I restriction-modification system subunit M N-terminal domain-containing protein n=1 Tax=Caldimonas tepidiphila TaxID=2315841 RepID=UPI000E5C2803|nr:type I restriction-modification system subunit M N-terminal domain-containing protein [Caldimonas tepidiphila]
MSSQNLSTLICAIAELLRCAFRQADYGKVILPFTLLRQLDCVWPLTKQAVLIELETCTRQGSADPNVFLTHASELKFFNTSPLDFDKVLPLLDHVHQNLRVYIHGFSSNISDIFERIEFEKQLDGLARPKLLYKVVRKFAERLCCTNGGAVG